MKLVQLKNHRENKQTVQKRQRQYSRPGLLTPCDKHTKVTPYLPSMTTIPGNLDIFSGFWHHCRKGRRLAVSLAQPSAAPFGRRSLAKTDRRSARHMGRPWFAKEGSSSSEAYVRYRTLAGARWYRPHFPSSLELARHVSRISVS
jgi:hypothetical protein